MIIHPISLLFVPAKERMISKVGELEADAYILDLEDSIAKEDKDIALEYIVSFLKRNSVCSNIIVRINPERVEKELSILDEFEHIGFMLPKFENPLVYKESIKYLKKHFVIALLESPKAIIKLDNICQTEWLKAIAFGAEDYTTIVNMENRIDNLQYHKNRIVTYAKAYEKQVFDTPSFRIDDIDEFHRDVDNAVALGFDGKLSISPKHIQYINYAFKNHDIDYLENIVKRYDADGNTVDIINGRIYEKMHIERYRKILKENKDKDK